MTEITTSIGSDDAETGVDDTTAATDTTDAASDATDGVAAVTDDVVEASAQPVDDGAAFLAELARAMQATASEERTRAAAEIDRRREQHLAGIDARRTAEVERMRKLADGDLQAIDAWAERERQRIQSERETRAAALRADLETSLTEHGSRIDREIERVEAAITVHRSEMDAFFTTLDTEADPVAIAQHASRRPVFPTLESVATEAPTASDAAPASDPPQATDVPTSDVPTSHADPAATGAGDATATSTAGLTPRGPGVGVMDPSPPKLAEAWSAWSGIGEATESENEGETKAVSADDASDATGADPAAAEASGPEEIEVAAVTSSGARPASGSLLQSTPVSRPMSWLRRGSHDDSNGDGAA
jgi:hypothetical protein